MRHHRFVLASLAIVAAFLASWPLEAAPPEGPSLTSADANIAYAISAICAPFVLDKVAETSLPTHQALVHGDDWNELAFQRLGVRPVRVGFAGFVHVAVAEKDGARRCEITARRALPASLRGAALNALAVRPEGFGPTRSRYLPGRFATEDMLCTARASEHPGTFILMSATYPEEQDSLAIEFTMVDSPERMTSCDHDGVEMNYRTLVKP